jgi:hypothetical protein
MRRASRWPWLFKLIASASAFTSSIGARPAAVHIRDADNVGVVEAGGEILEQIAQARVAVRLHDGEHAAFRHLARG